jgi:hypothetical protein
VRVKRVNQRARNARAGSSCMYSVFVLTILLMFGVGPSANALGRDDTQNERIKTDDDPVIVPRSVAVPDSSVIDPETTGSIDRRSVKRSRSCETIAWYSGRTPDTEYREAC